MSSIVVRKRTVGDVLFALAGLVIVWLVKQLAKLVALVAVQLAIHWRTTLTAAAVTAAVLWRGWFSVTLTVAGVLLAASIWRAAHPPTFDRYLGAWVRTWWRRWWVYRRQWDAVMVRCGLAVKVQDEQYPPKLARVATTPYWDRLTVRMQIGHEPAQFHKAADRLRTGFAAQRIVVQEIAPARLSIDLMRRDPLVEIVPPAPMPATTAAIDFAHLPVGLDEFGDPYTVSVVGGHTSIAGSTGAGKAGLQWNVLRGLAPAIADGTVRLVGIDPKAKELRQARELYADEDYAVGPDEVLALLQRLVDELAAANDADGANGERDFVPSTARPLTLIQIDELAPLLAYWPRTTRQKIEDFLGLLLTQGRAAGFILLGAIQEPTKDIFKIRDLFTRRLAMRLPTESHTDAALVEHAVDYGAQCHQISELTPGVLFSLQDGATSTVRARLGCVTNDDIRALVEYVQALRTVVHLDSRRPAAGTGAEAA
jgi:DNA segregation ATPase FtsK/SpoIIIE, S-DNA-T family